MYRECAFFFLYLVFSITSVYILGRIITKTLFSEKYKAIFYSLTFGILFIVLFVSLLITSLKTIHVFFFIPIGIIFVLNKNKIVVNNPFKVINLREEFKQLLKLYLTAIPVFTIASVTFFRFDLFAYQMQHQDFFAYSKFCQGIFESGNENYFRESNILFPEIFHGLNPYHYFELWLNIFFGNLFKVSYLKSLLLISYPLLQLTCLFGIIHLINSIIPEKYKFTTLLFLAFIVIFIQPIYFEFYDNYELLRYHVGFCNTSPLSFGRKYAAVFMFFILFFLLYTNENKKEALILISSMPIVSIGLLPGIFLGGAIYVFINVVLKKYNQYFLFGIYTLSLSAAILVFYKLNTIDFTKDLINDKNLISLIIRNGLSVLVIKKFLFLIIFPLTRVILFLAPYLLILFLLLRKSLNSDSFDLIKLIFLITISGAIGSGLAFDLPDSGQLLTNCLPLINILIIYLFIYTLGHRKLYIKEFSLSILCIYNAINNFSFIKKMNDNYYSVSNSKYDHNFLSNCIKEIEGKENIIIGYLYDTTNSKINPHTELYKSPGIPFEFANNNPISICLNNPKNIDTSGYGNSFKNMWPFHIFQIQNNSTGYAKLLNKFINDFNVDYLLIQGMNIPREIDFKLELFESDNNFKFYRILNSPVSK